MTASVNSWLLHLLVTAIPCRAFVSTWRGNAVPSAVGTNIAPLRSSVEKEQKNGASDVNGFSSSDLEILKQALTAGEDALGASDTSPEAPLGLTPEQIAELKAFLQSDLHPFERDEYWAEVNKHVTEATTMPPEAFRSVDFYDIEQEKIFAKTWQVAAFTDELREVGDVVTANVAGQPILLTKARDGEIRGFYNVCRHRGARLVKNPTECGKKSIACPYHSWGYALDGRLVGTPLWGKENKVPDEILAERLEASGTRNDIENFDKADFGLLPVRVETWGPFVYANVGGDAPPLKEYLGRVTTDLELYPFDEFVTVRKDTLDVKANWKLLAENFMDFYHVPVRILCLTVLKKIPSNIAHTLVILVRRYTLVTAKSRVSMTTTVAKVMACIYAMSRTRSPMLDRLWI
jgi:nitrite reductase/ring-hydroxylating ferredoxin subunit